MSQKQSKKGKINYTGRAFQQDAQEAMHGDIVRGIIELVTNSDDAYRDAEGKILIEVERRRGTDWRLTVRDRARGMTAKEIADKICTLGVRSSGFEEGEAVRGQLGRGVKDLVAFGAVVFEAIKDDRYVRLRLEPTGDYDFETETKASSEHRQELGIPRGNGMSVTVQASPHVKCPHHSRLAERLAKHFQLRGIMSEREVRLVDVNNEKSDVLRYSFPAFPVVFEANVPIPEYPGVSAKVTIRRNAERCEDPASEPCRPSGLLIRGARAFYENTLFGLESRPHAGWFSGEVVCHYIDQLAREFDDRWSAKKEADAANPMPIVTRGRDGLQRSHPFFRALSAAVEAPLKKLVAEEERKSRESGAHESSGLRRCLDLLGKNLTRQITDDLKDIDEELDGGGDKAALAEVRVIPEEATLYIGENKTLTVRVRKDLGVRTITVRPDPEGVVELLDVGEIPLEPHSQRKDLLVGRLRVRPLIEGKQTILTIKAGAHECFALLEIEAERKEEEVEVAPPDGLKFERDSYRVAWQKKGRLLRLYAPADVIAEEGADVRITSSDPGVVVLEGGRATFVFDDVVEYYVASVKIDARTLNAKGTLTAQMGSSKASAIVVVAQDDDGPKLEIKIRDEEAGHRRALVDTASDRTVIAIMGRHPAVRRYFGPAPAFPHQDLSASRAIIAEIVAGEATRMVMEKKFPSAGGTAGLDAAAFYAEHAKYLAKYLSSCHKALVLDSALKAA